MSKKKILVVDDEKLIVQMYKTLIEDEFPECVVDAAFDGLEAYDCAIHKKYDLIITDHKMPFMTGFELIRGLREKKSINMKTPVIFISAYLPDFEKEAELFDDVYLMSKPADMDRLLTYLKISTHSKPN